MTSDLLVLIVGIVIGVALHGAGGRLGSWLHDRKIKKAADKMRKKS